VPFVGATAFTPSFERLRAGVVGSAFAAFARDARAVLTGFAVAFAAGLAAPGFVGLAGLVALLARLAGADPFASFTEVRFAGVLVAVRLTGSLVAGLAFVAATYSLSPLPTSPRRSHLPRADTMAGCLALCRMSASYQS
jgi:hypothetical protein